ncbi:LCP family glycopolymer transferase [Nonomuraea aurantiaca]|uniref:LCP family glycopolymer transferase n=1 Tax=Nonomuraea aurantiaca TaxID=2878562 RepID=UPI001CD958AE|nr:LCP family protein [Nonomuraea aurantiaca]MCA2228704.1 LCP family protein [Nonomuraea aurantiaca]
MTVRKRGYGLGFSIALTLASALLWGVAHLAADRRRTGIALMVTYVLMLASILIVLTVFSSRLLSLAVQPAWLTALTIMVATLGVVWTSVIIWSYLLVRPAPANRVGRAVTTVLTIALCGLILAPAVYAARVAYVSRDVVNTLFTASVSPIVSQDPWNGARRINLLLLGGDAAPGRPGVRTDSMTVASVDVATGATTLLGLPRNLQRVRMPEGPPRDRFPDGFTGAGPDTPGLLNEVFQYAEDYPEMEPGVRKGQRGPTLLKKTISDILGIPITYYALVDMRGFAQIIDAMGGVTVTIKEPIVYGKYREGLLSPGTRKLSGAEALWFGRSRTDSDDYVRMGRQKCLLNAVAKQADPVTVLNSFEKLAVATKRAISTDIPQNVLPDLVELAQKVKEHKIKSLNFVPPLIDTVYPDWLLIRHKVTQALAEQSSPTRHPQAAPQTGSPENPITLDSVCR